MKNRTVLVIDDDPIDRESYVRALRRAPNVETEVLEAETGSDGLAMAEVRHIDCVLLDYNLPDMDGLCVLRELRKRSSVAEIPVVMMTGAGTEQIAVETMKEGCQDYVVKNHEFAKAVPKAVDMAIEKVALRRELEEKRLALEDAQREQVLLRDKFLSHVSHELRTPLAAVHQFVSLCLDGLAGDLSDTQREYLEIAFRNVSQLKAMIADLMEVTRAEAGKLRVDVQPVELGPLLQEAAVTLRAAAADQGIDLRHEPGPERIPTVLADPTRVRQLLVNLIENAIKFTGQGGHISVKAGVKDGFVRVSVLDTGCGLDLEAQARVFDRLHQEHAGGGDSREGLGLGLAICKELVLLQAGRIWVESMQGVGSTFHFTLPVYSLARLIEPSVTRKGELRETFGVLRVGLVLEDPGASGPLCEEHLAGVRRLLRKLVYYETDAVVPVPWRTESEGTVFVVCAADAEGVAAMLARIRRHLDDYSTGHLRGARVRVQARVEETRERDRNAPIDDAIESVGRRISQLIQNSSEWKE